MSSKASNGMRTIGLIGGMSWESTAVYYRRLNEQVRERLGGLHSADILMRSVNFDAIVSLQKQGNWDEASRILVDIARGLEPVSYTHLRAHETRHDLVCRLL